MIIKNTRIVFFCLVAVLVLFEESYAVPAKGSTDSSKAAEKIKKGRIVAGKPIPINQAPFIVQIRTRFGNNFICGGAIVSPWHVVSAAHCFHIYRKSQLMVIAAEEHLERLPHIKYSNKMPKKRNVAAIYRHPDYVENSSENADVAVLKLSNHLNNGRNSKIIPLCRSPLKSTDAIDVIGWGHTEVDSKSHSNELMMVTLPVMSMEECRDVYRNTTHEITDTMFCSGIYERKDACQGDSGGPAVRKGNSNTTELCGVVSWGIGCGSGSYPGVYTNVLAVTDFIQDCLDDKCIEDE